MSDIREGHNRLGCFLLMWGEGQVGCRGPVPVYNHLWVAVAAEGSGDMLPFCVLVNDGGAGFFRRVSRVRITAILWVNGWCEA